MELTAARRSYLIGPQKDAKGKSVPKAQVKRWSMDEMRELSKKSAERKAQRAEKAAETIEDGITTTPG